MVAVHFYITTLGCKVNQYETRSLLEAWREQGWVCAPSPERADFILINSCAVTARAVADVRATARRLRREAPAARIWLTGCAAEAALDELAGLDEVDEFVGQASKEKLACLPSRAPFGWKSREKEASDGEENNHQSGFPEFRISGYDRSRPVLKVQDGCSHRCTYCIVPLTRGPARSRRAQESLAEIRRLLDAGFREITLSGINLRQYRHRLNQQRPGRAGALAETPKDLSDGRAHPEAAGDFWDLVAFLEQELAPEWAGRARLRISSLEPGQLHARARDILNASRLVAPQLHLSLQSGSPSVLQRMGRGHYDPAGIADFLDGLAWPLFGLGADILTGFPGETEAEFLQTLELCRSLPFSYAHVFPYSRRPGTEAAAMDGHLPQELKKERAAALRQAVQEKQHDFLLRLAALPRLQVVFENAGNAEAEPQAEIDFAAEQTGSPFSGTDSAVEPESAAETRPPGARQEKSRTATQEARTPGGKQRANTPEGRLRGVCEYYADCILEGDAQSVRPGQITPVTVLGVSHGLLRVCPVGGTP